MAQIIFLFSHSPVISSRVGDGRDARTDQRGRVFEAHLRRSKRGTENTFLWQTAPEFFSLRISSMKPFDGQKCPFEKVNQGLLKNAVVDQMHQENDLIFAFRLMTWCRLFT